MILQKAIRDIKLNIDKSLNILNLISEDNFDLEFPKAVGFIKEAGNIKINYENKCSKDEIKEFEKKIFPLTKLLKEKFDNIIAGKQLKILDIAKKLNELNNKKKLVNYSR
jgi:hypothetical protein